MSSNVCLNQIDNKMTVLVSRNLAFVNHTMTKVNIPIARGKEYNRIRAPSSITRNTENVMSVATLKRSCPESYFKYIIAIMTVKSRMVCLLR